MTDSLFAALGDESFVSLTTFRKSGERVSTPVWIARDGDALVVTTPQDTGKVKRLRNSGRVELAPSNRMGKVADGATTTAGFARIHADDAAKERVTAIIRKKYRFEYHVVTIIETLVNKGRKPRVMLRITPAE